jgi:predicted acylesterase/phospholipase RssA
MVSDRKLKRRGFVMTGGGAKGLYEAGVIHAFHIAGMEFDVITGSSIGAFNSVFFAEYLLQKKRLSSDLREDPQSAVAAMDNMVKAYHHAWLQMPDKKIIDDSESGPLGKLKDDLLQFNVCLPDITRLIWWWTDPERKSVPAPGVWPTLVKLGKELAERLGDTGALLDIIKNYRNEPFQKAVRTYLARFDMEKSLIPPDEVDNLSSVFTEPITPLALEHLLDEKHGDAGQHGEQIILIPADRTLRDYAQEGIDVRVTRANYRTGRLEISAYLSIQDFVRYLWKQAYRLEKADPDKIPLGSFRLQLPGNPNAINSALASGRFPGVLPPYPVEDLYPQADPENGLLYAMLTDWLDDSEVETKLTEAYKEEYAEESLDKWESAYQQWQESKSMQAFFPNAQDVYVDGGAIDNTPSNSAVDATREWAEAAEMSKRDVVLDLYVVFLSPEPTLEPAEVQDQAFHQVIQRTLEIQGAAQQSSDAVVVNTINTFGKRAERLGDTLLVLLESYQETLSSLDEGQREAALDQLREKARQQKLRGFLGSSGEGILERMDGWASDLISARLPLHVDTVIVYPDEMPLDTLQFTERLGYRQENAIDMLTMGCYHTLWALLIHLEGNGKALDDHDQQVLGLVKNWTGIEDLPKEPEELEDLRQNWRCRRTECVYHAQHCPYGKQITKV